MPRVIDTYVKKKREKFFPRLICVGQYTKRCTRAALCSNHPQSLLSLAIIADNVTHGSTSILVILCQGRENYSRHLYPTGVKDPWAFESFPKYCCCIISTRRRERGSGVEYPTYPRAIRSLLYDLISVRERIVFVQHGFRSKFGITVLYAIARNYFYYYRFINNSFDFFFPSNVYIRYKFLKKFFQVQYHKKLLNFFARDFYKNFLE